MRHSSTVKETGEKIIRTVVPTKNLERLKKQLEFSDTFENRQLLAKEYMELGAYENSMTLYESCLEGIFENEPDIILDLAHAHFLNETYDEAKERLIQLKKMNPDSMNKKPRLLLAMTYEKLDEVENAIDQYESIVNVYAGEEARCRYAILLKKNGDQERAEKLFNEIIWGARRSPRYYRKAQKKWIAIAKENLREDNTTINQP